MTSSLYALFDLLFSLSELLDDLIVSAYFFSEPGMIYNLFDRRTLAWIISYHSYKKIFKLLAKEFAITMEFPKAFVIFFLNQIIGSVSWIRRAKREKTL